MEKINLNEYLASNEYPGRGIAVAMAPVFQGENLERREPVNCFYRAPVVPLSLLHGQVQPLCTIGQNSESLPL
jgi:hypothetical protein